MFTLSTTVHNRYNTALIYVGILEEIRAELIGEAMDNRVYISEDFADQVEVVFPTDPSELDDDAVLVTPRELTPELLTALAANILGTSVKHITVEEVATPATTDTLAGLVDRVHHTGPEVARIIAKGTVEANNTSPLMAVNPAAMTERELGRLWQAASMLASELPHDTADEEELEVAVKMATSAVEFSALELERARIYRDVTIRVAVAKGLSGANVARAAHVTRQRVASILAN
ncbi:hypothetical protein C1Y63_06130 [Corynebacterium sp. 13CS0277]|uniref:hypothetical protein n=1 Tax=Corynebacterium sp. 13CS0277 TaxID=2071994 RepID=UPI000D031870|nr:hypothetical protein [Corynebacterium sp. 13CS0277]PRQ11425.1 hypothetical protein C1Y63_06130 [Corynebacterium sp. 13CS0277]